MTQSDARTPKKNLAAGKAKRAKAPPAPKKKIPEEIRWQAWLAGERPWLSAFAFLIIVGTVLFLGFKVHLWAGVLAFLVFFAMLNPYFVPTSYYITKEEVRIKKFYYTDRRDWKMFRRFFLTRSGVVLSTFAARQRFLDSFRGVQLLLPRDRDERERILDFIESKLPLDPGQSRK